MQHTGSCVPLASKIDATAAPRSLLAGGAARLQLDSAVAGHHVTSETSWKRHAFACLFIESINIPRDGSFTNQLRVCVNKYIRLRA